MSAPSAIFRFVASAAVFAAGMLFVPFSMAQPWPATSCAGDRAATNLNCTANDIKIAGLTSSTSSCLAGETVTLSFTASIEANASDRHDIGVFIAQDGKSPTYMSSSGGSASCAVYDLPTSPLPLDNIDGDACGDIRAYSGVFVIPETLTATIKCIPGADGNLTVPTAVTWDQQPGLVCQGPDYVGTGSPAKCESGLVSVPTTKVLGSIHITKQTTPDLAAGTFSFSATGTGATPSSFTLGDNGTQVIATDPLTRAGSDYTVSEGALAGFLPTAQIACQDSAGQPQTTFVTTDGANRSVTLHMAADPANGLSEVYCTFTNTQVIAGSITIEKTTSGGDGTFSFANTGGVADSLTNPSAFDITTSTTTHRGTKELSNLAAGTYTITETVPSGWDLTSPISCAATVGSPTITQVANGVTIELHMPASTVDGVACTFNDVKRGSITIAKSASPKDAQVFTFSTTSNPNTTALPTSFNLADSGTPPNSITFPDLLPGVYTVTEAAVTDWVRSNLVCSGGGNVVTDVAGGLATITLAAGENVSCTYSNVKKGTITVTKNAIGGAGGETFAFTGALSGSIQTGQVLQGTFAAGTHSVTESVPAGWQLSNIVCSGTATVTFTGASGGTDAFEPGDTTANITLADGQTAACTFTNVGNGSIRIVKHALGADGTFSFTGAQSFQIATSAGVGEDATTFASVKAGYYVVQETVPAGWRFSGLTCSNSSAVDVAVATAFVTVVPGEHVTCTFENTRVFEPSRTSAIVITKRVLGDDPMTATFQVPSSLVESGTFTLTPPIGPDRRGEDTRIFGSLLAGTYTVSELMLPAGWASAGITCTDPSGDTVVDLQSRTAVIQVAEDEGVRCVFDNVSLSNITVNVVSTGGTGYFGFSTPGLGPDYLEATLNPDVPNGRTFYSLMPGTYQVVGLGGGPSWQLYAVQCVGDESGDMYWTIGGATTTIVLPHGEDVVCTYFYRVQPIGPHAGPAEGIPTLGEWGMIIMASLLAFTAVVMLRRREAASRGGDR